MRYFLWGTLAAEAHPRDVLLDSVIADLQHATFIDHRLPRAWSLLSAALATRGRLPEAAEAARQALAADRYLENTEEILLRLYETSLDLGKDSAAVHWCAEVGRRDPGSVVWANCTLGLLAWSSVAPASGSPDPWRILQAVRDSSHIMRQFRPELAMQVAAVLARRGERDSARAVIRRAAAAAGKTPPPPLLRLEALALATLGDPAAADSVAAAFARYDPAAAQRLRQSRAFKLLLRAVGPLDQGIPTVPYRHSGTRAVK